MVWLNMSYRSIHKILYDKTMCVPIINDTGVYELLNKATIAALTLQNQQQLIDRLKTDPKFVKNMSLKPNKVS